MKHVVHIKTLVPNCHAALVLLNGVYQQIESRQWSKSRAEFLGERLKTAGALLCEYCGKNLKLKTKKSSEIATVDHVVSIASGGKEFDHSNFAVSCSSCNRKKGNMSVESFSCIKTKNKR